MTNRTPDKWMRDTAWKHGPRKIVVSGERPDPMQLPETAGEPGPPSARRRVSLHDFLLLVGVTMLLGGLYILADAMVKMR